MRGTGLWTAHTRQGLDAALAQIPRSSQAKILVRVDGTGATHGLLKRLQALNTTQRSQRRQQGGALRVTPVGRVERSSQGSGVQDRGDHTESPMRSQGFTPTGVRTVARESPGICSMSPRVFLSGASPGGPFAGEGGPGASGGAGAPASAAARRPVGEGAAERVVRRWAVQLPAGGGAGHRPR